MAVRFLVALFFGTLCLQGLPGFAERDGSPVVRFASPGYHYTFPYDHGAHEEFRTEWWYYTGHLTTEQGRRFGYELTFFRQSMTDERVQSNPSRWAVRHLYLAHFALTDLGDQRFRYAEKVSRAGLGKAGADVGTLHVWIDQWAAQSDPDDSHRHHLHAVADDMAIDLALVSAKPPVVHGRDGVSLKGRSPGQASHYYSLTRMATTGVLSVGTRSYEVQGTSWMDHEFGSAELGKDQVGWDWFSIQLQNGTELMFYSLRHADQTSDDVSSGTYVAADSSARHLSVHEVALEATGHWDSPESGAEYPAGWRLEVPSLDLSLSITPQLANQELITSRSTQVTYWEGAVEIAGTQHGQPVRGEGYVELTGYAVPFRPHPP